MPVRLTNRQRRFPVDGERLAEQARQCLDHLGLGFAELSLLLVNDRAMRALNRDHRGIHRTTDVLSFPMFEGPPEAVADALEQEVDEAAPPLGDVVISVERAHRQARRAGVTPDAELALLVVHGILHLAGYDHERSADEARRMAREERALLQALGVRDASLVERGLA